jgi:hypothetical protein
MLASTLERLALCQNNELEYSRAVEMQRERMLQYVRSSEPLWPMAGRHMESFQDFPASWPASFLFLNGGTSVESFNAAAPFSAAPDQKNSCCQRCKNRQSGIFVNMKLTL